MRPREHRRLNQGPDGYRFIPAGTFWKGGSEDDPYIWDNEVPQHLVTLTKPFWMQQTEVTREEFQYVMGYKPPVSFSIKSEHFTEDREFLPVDSVSWYEAIVYCNKLSERDEIEPAYILHNVQKAGRSRIIDKIEEVEWNRNSNGYRLPTEAEWEYACRAGTKTPIYGNIDDIAWSLRNSGGGPHPVGQKQPNNWGLYDMLGNVHEWCWDLYGRYFRGKQIDPINTVIPTEQFQFRIFRGGAWNSLAHFCRASARSYNHPISRFNNLGFRPCRFLLPSEILPSDYWQKETEEVMFENPLELRRLPNRRMR